MNDQLTTELLPGNVENAAQGGAFSLIVVCEGVSSAYPLPETGRVLIGRARHAEVRIDHASISREHAALHITSELQVEDLGSANGTQLRGATLPPHSPQVLRPREVIEVGRALLVVQHRRLEQRLQRVCAPAFFDVRVEEERERTPPVAFAVGRLEVQGELDAPAVEYLLASALSDRDLITCSAPGNYQLLLLGADHDEAGRRIEAAAQVLRARRLEVRTQLEHFPRPGAGPRPARSPALQALSAGSFVVVADDSMRRVCRLLERVAASDLAVLLLGETGVGKEMCAELLHQASARARAPLVRLNCAALPESLLESELFGYERGAFTGATTAKAGLLETAHGGSVFFDEVGDMPLSTQVKLLRVVETKQVQRLGARSPQPVDVRVIAATNQNLQELITKGRFREDLYYRLSGIAVLVPPLRERQADLEPLIGHFMAVHGKAPLPRLSSESLRYLRSHSWPGNVRELKNTIQRALVLCDGALLEPEHLQHAPLARGASSGVPAASLHDEVKSLERERIEQALRDADGNQRKAAVLLGISRGALLRRLKDLGLGRSGA